MKIESRLFVVGASGYIGKCVIEQAKSRFEVVSTSSSGDGDTLRLQLAQPEDFDYSAIRPSDIFLVTAAISSPDVCASKRDYAWSVNVTGTSEFIANLIARDARVIFFSSDTVYGEREERFDEDADCHPAGEYALMKYEVETRFRGNPNFKSIRLSYVFSREDKFTKYLIGCAERGEEAELFHPFYRAIVHRSDVVEGALMLAERWDEFPEQIINFGGPEALSRIEFAECLKRAASLNLKVRVTQPDNSFFESRPRIIAMSSPVLPRLLGRPMHTLLEAASIEFKNRNVPK